MFQNIHTSSVAASLLKTVCKYSKFTCLLEMLHYQLSNIKAIKSSFQINYSTSKTK